MRPVTVTVTGNGASPLNSPPVIIDYLKTPTNLGLQFTSSGNTTQFKVQYSLDDPWASYATDYNTNAQWFDHGTMTAMSAATAGSQITPVRAVRLQSGITGADTGTLKVVQAGVG